MIGMVVCYQDSYNLFHGYAVFPQCFGYGTDTNTRIYKNTILSRTEIVTVATATTTQTEKLILSFGKKVVLHSVYKGKKSRNKKGA